ncbi:hypothetical protein F5Y09DRAFT_322320 [Xylaria sp. FL1042]|nr:hypothetical protein F5Y09DRAFT_322320 [Xylaria sp. FL1042]
MVCVRSLLACRSNVTALSFFRPSSVLFFCGLPAICHPWFAIPSSPCFGALFPCFPPLPFFFSLFFFNPFSLGRGGIADPCRQGVLLLYIGITCACTYVYVHVYVCVCVCVHLCGRI